MATISVDQFGKDHWSTFAYIETRCVDYRGRLDKRHMRCDRDRHPGHDVNSVTIGNTKYPTILRDGMLRSNHDDWDCADDLEAAGLLNVNGTGQNPIFKLTEKGQAVISELRKHMSRGGSSGSFVPC